MGRPSTETKTLRAERQDARLSARTAQASGSCSHELVRTSPDLAPHHSFETGSHRLAHPREHPEDEPLARRLTMAAATTWWDACSSEAARRSTSSGLSPGAVSTATSRAPPTVSVPVLSNMTVWVRASASSAPPPLIRMPSRAAHETPLR